MNKYLPFFFIIILLFCTIFTKAVSAETIEYDSFTITTDGEIFVTNEVENIVYVGGNFKTIQLNEGPVENRNNIAAFSLAQGAILPWNPQVSITVRSIEFDDDQIIVKDYLDTDEDTTQPKNQVIINATSGDIINPTPIPTSTPTPTPTTVVVAAADPPESELMVDSSALGFEIPTLSDVLTFAIRGFFVIAGLAALFFLLIGAFNWITSGGDKDSVQSARDKMQAAIVGVLMMVAVLGIVWTLEQVVFGGHLCFGISCPVTIPVLLEPA